MAQTAVVKTLENSPAVSIGFGATELSRRRPVWIKSDVVAFGDTASINLVELPGNCLVVNALVNVQTAFDGTGTSAAATAVLAVPNDTGTETLWDASTLGLGTTGFKPATGYAKVPATGGYAILTYTPGTTTAGQLEVYLEVVLLEDLL